MGRAGRKRRPIRTSAVVGCGGEEENISVSGFLDGVYDGGDPFLESKRHCDNIDLPLLGCPFNGLGILSVLLSGQMLEELIFNTYVDDPLIRMLVKAVMKHLRNVKICARSHFEDEVSSMCAMSVNLRLLF